MKFFSLLVVFLAAVIHATEAAAATPQEISAQLEQFMRQQVDQRQFSGTVLVAREGRILLEKGYGFRNRERSEPNSSDTKFRIASLTKQFTAALILQLREQRLLDTSDSICKFLQPCPEAWNPVTLHHLLSLTDGIPGGPAKPAQATDSPWTVKNVFDSYRDKALASAPGDRWAYSDTAYSLLGMVIEKVAGKPYGEVVRRQILEPLGMRDSGYDSALVAAFAAGGLSSTVRDLYKWDQALYSTSVLQQASLDLMWTEVKSNYAYGWMVSRHVAGTPKTAWWGLEGRFEVAHAGAIEGFTSEILRFPKERVVVIVLAHVLANQQDAPPIGPFLAGIVFGQPFSLPSRGR